MQFSSTRCLLIQNPSHACAMSALVLLGPSPTSDQFPDLSVPTDPNNADTLHAASTQYSNPTSWRGTNRQMGQTEIENHNPLSSHQDVYGGSGVSAALESSYTIDASSSLPADSYPKSGAQDDHADATLLFPGQVEGVAPNLVEIQGQEASLQRERKFIEKRERDKARKKIERRKDADDYARICEVLDISLTPRSTLAHRSEFLCIHSRRRY